MQLVSCGMTDVGMRRTHNEDNFLINDEFQLFVVCDGMGGHVGGEVASAIAVRTVEEAFMEQSWSVVGQSLEDRLQLAEEHIRVAVRLAGSKIHDAAKKERRYRGMGTTCVVMYVQDSRCIVAHVGDSRGYLIRDNTIEQLTEDHSLVNERIRAGLMTAEEAKNYRFKNVITRSLGFNEHVEIDVQTIPLQVGDYLMMCSDGLSNLVDEEKMASIILENPLQNAARMLIKLACDNGGDDNITVVIVRVDEL